MEKFPALENFGKMLKVSHFYLGFSLDKNNNQIKHSQSVLLEFSELDFETLIKHYKSSKIWIK